MSGALQYQIERLKTQFLNLSTLVEEILAKSIDSFNTMDPELARDVIQRDAKIDQMEIDLEEECLKILALYQPVAKDLRFIISVLKINNDLERIGDLSANIAKRVLVLHKETLPEVFDFRSVMDKTRQMLTKSLNAMVYQNMGLAKEVCVLDDAIDAFKRDITKKVLSSIPKYADKAEALFSVLSVARHLERIADYATNIAEDAIYMITGEIIRHHSRVQ